VFYVQNVWVRVTALGSKVTGREPIGPDDDEQGVQRVQPVHDAASPSATDHAAVVAPRPANAELPICSAA